MIQDTIWECEKNTHKKHHIQESQAMSPFPAGDDKAASNRQDRTTKTIRNTNNRNGPQKKHRLGTGLSGIKETEYVHFSISFILLYHDFNQ